MIILPWQEAFRAWTCSLQLAFYAALPSGKQEVSPSPQCHLLPGADPFLLPIMP